YESEHFNFCPSLNCQHLDVAICCERVGIVAEKNPQSGAECRIEDILSPYLVRELRTLPLKKNRG
ncbi:hypothetical protein, partial [Aeromonas australiensis]|uniref:hypothetical protein n=1 Tax=Aeromonas australiensis TaxID=1114880 RepID=UPI001F3A5371